MIFQGNQYAKVFFKKKRDQGICKGCHFRRKEGNGSLCDRPPAVPYTPHPLRCTAPNKKTYRTSWSWVRIGKASE